MANQVVDHQLESLNDEINKVDAHVHNIYMYSQFTYIHKCMHMVILTCLFIHIVQVHWPENTPSIGRVWQIQEGLEDNARS